MFFRSVACLCVCFLFLGVRSQRGWGSSVGGYNSGFSNSWSSSNGLPNNNNPSTGNGNDAGSWGSTFGRRPNGNVRPPKSEQNPNREYETSSNSENGSGWNRGKPGEVPGGDSAGRRTDSSRRPSEKPSAVTNFPSSSKWSANSNAFQSGDDGNVAFSSWGSSGAGKPSSGQNNGLNPKPGDWYSSNPGGNNPSENEILPESDNEIGSTYPSRGSSNKKKSKPTFGSSGGSGNRESTTQKNSGTSNWESSGNYKPQRFPGTEGWNSNDSSQPGKGKPQTSVNGQNEKPSILDTSILDELDKNDWYFGKESNYPNPPFRSTLNIDVSELWNFDKSKKPNSRESSNVNNSNGTIRKKNDRRWNRQIQGVGSAQCECVNVNLCEEEDVVFTRKFGLRPVEEFGCEKLTDVCCSSPKTKVGNRANFNQKRKQLACGERRLGQMPFSRLRDDIAEPGEFPWNLKLENAETNCSASLIHHKMALTAAHCVAGTQPEELALKAGLWNSNDERPQSRRVRKIIPHPDYDSRNPRNDIAVLVLETPFELTDNVNTICLPVTNDKWDSNRCLVAGWRPEEIHGQVLEILEKGVVDFLPQTECQNIMLVTDLWRNYILHDSFVCGLEKTGRKSCTGDEGGFVICPSKKSPGTYIQIGVVSKGMNCDEFGRPGIFTNVLTFLDWINKNYFELGLFDDIDIRSLAASQ